MFKVNNKDTGTTSMTHFTHSPGVSIADLEQVKTGWVNGMLNIH